MTLEEVAKLVENAAVSQAESQAEETQGINLRYQYSATIHNVTIRGQIISREQLDSYPAKDHIHDGETSNLLYSFDATSSRGQLLYCPCFLMCYICSVTCGSYCSRKSSQARRQDKQ